jgi:hypothetical protein
VSEFACRHNVGKTMKKAKKIWSDRKLSMHSNESGKGG